MMSRHSASRIPHPALRRGQASLEMTAAIIGALTLLFGAVRFTLWCTERYMARIEAYDRDRLLAANSAWLGGSWYGSYEPKERLNILNEPVNQQ